MKPTSFVLSIVLFGSLVAVPAGAQRGRGGGGGGGRRNGNSEAEQGSGVMPQPVNAVNLLIMHSRDLVLSDSLVKRIVAIKRGVDSTNTPLMRRFDSLQAVIRRRGPSKPEWRDSVDDPDPVLQRTIAEIRVNIEPARVAAYALLSPDQLEKAKAYEDAAGQKYEEQVTAARGGPRGRGG
jgi:hypothetical protein